MLVCGASMHEPSGGPHADAAGAAGAIGDAARRDLEELGDLLEVALARPGDLSPRAATLARERLARTGTAADDLLTYGLCAAIAYGRPDLLEPGMVAPLADRLRAVSSASAPALAETFSHLAHTPLADRALRALLAAAAGPAPQTLYAALGGAAVELLATFVEHHPALWSLDDASRGLPVDPALRETYVGLVLEPVLLRRCAMLSAAELERLDRRLSTSRRWLWALATLAGRAQAEAGARELARTLAADRLEHRDAAEPLRRDAFHLVVLMNVRIGLGDELIRVGPLVQALLDANPRARATVVTPRPFVYDHPRVRAVDLHGDAAESALRLPMDGLFILHEPLAPEVLLRQDLDALGQAMAGVPELFLLGDAGRGYFLFARARLGTLELAFRAGLDRPGLPRVYDPTRRLLLELRLPLRIGEERPPAGNVLTAGGSPESEGLWRQLVPPGRRAAVVNPFGGAHRVKGYLPEQAGEVAAGLASLVREGFRVVLLPNGEPWSDAATVRSILEALAPDVALDVVVAPDPALEDPRWTGWLRERPELRWADRVTRAHKFFLEYADLVVAVEGWVGHFASHLGRPFRLVLRTDSDTSRWYPVLRGEHQVLVSDLAGEGPAPAADALDGVPIAPSLPRRAMLHRALDAVAALGGDRALTLLRRAAASPEQRTRCLALRSIAAVDARSGHPPTTSSELLPHLLDRRAAVRAAAAESLLTLDVDLSATLGPEYRRVLSAYAAIGRQQWPAVVVLGTAALPALARAATDEAHLVRAEAGWAVRTILGPLAEPFLARRRG